MDWCVFFDESGTHTNSNALMGALTIPESIYNTKIFSKYNDLMRKNKNLNIHYTVVKNLPPDNKNVKVIIELFTEVFKNYKDYMNFNVVAFPFQTSSEYLPDECRKIFNFLIMPEMAISNALSNEYRSSFIFIEKSTVYETLNFKSYLKKELKNKKNNISYVKKREQIGVEITDIILGVIRDVIYNEYSNLALSLLEIDKFNEFLGKVKYKQCDMQVIQEYDFRKKIDDYLLGNKNNITIKNNAPEEFLKEQQDLFEKIYEVHQNNENKLKKINFVTEKLSLQNNKKNKKYKDKLIRKINTCKKLKEEYDELKKNGYKLICNIFIQEVNHESDYKKHINFLKLSYLEFKNKTIKAEQKFNKLKIDELANAFSNCANYKKGTLENLLEKKLL